MKSHPIAQALVAGLPQGLGERYGDDAMKAAGEQLAKQAIKGRPSSLGRPLVRPGARLSGAKGKR